MPAHKSLVVKSEWKSAGRKRTCYHDPKHSILKGDDVLEVAVGMGSQGYCRTCGQAMVTAAISRLQKMQPSN
jgi:hypothetical protein